MFGVTCCTPRTISKAIKIICYVLIVLPGEKKRLLDVMYEARTHTHTHISPHFHILIMHTAAHIVWWRCYGCHISFVYHFVLEICRWRFIFQLSCLTLSGALQIEYEKNNKTIVTAQREKNGQQEK